MISTRYPSLNTTSLTNGSTMCNTHYKENVLIKLVLTLLLLVILRCLQIATLDSCMQGFPRGSIHPTHRLFHKSTAWALSRILSTLAVVIIAAYRQHKVPLFAGNLYASSDLCSASDQSIRYLPTSSLGKVRTSS